MGEHNVGYSHIGILFSHKKKEVLTQFNIRKALCLVKKIQMQKGKSWIVPLIQNLLDKQIHRDRT